MNKITSKPLYLHRFAQLAKLGETVFHSSDLASLWQIQNSNTLYTTLKRYAKQGLLVRIYKGLYSIKPITEIDPLLLGIKAIHAYAYISAETILAEEGIIQQKIAPITIVCGKSYRFSIGEHEYYSRKLADKFLYQPIGIVQTSEVKKAIKERAIADLLYFNPKAYFDNTNIDWEKVKNIQFVIGYPLTPKRYT